MRILISAASELFTDNKPHGEGLICYEIVSRLAARGHSLHVFSPQSSLEERLVNTQVEHINDQAFTPSLNTWKYHQESRKAAQKLENTHKVDVIHHIMPFYHETHFSFLSNAPLVLGPLSLPWMLEDNEIESPHINGNPAKKLAKGVLGKISQRRYYRTLNRAQSILVAVGAMHNSLPLQLRDKSKLVPFGVNTEQFKPSDYQGPKPTILFLANLLKRKGLRFLLEAMPSIIQNIPDVELNVIGGGPSEIYFRNLAKEWGISSHVEFEGPVSHNKTVKWFQQCDLYCLPSLGEPFGISLLEAMSCGKPVVTTRAGGVPDFVEDGKCGYLVPPRDRQALATAIIKILTDSSLAKKMGDYNRELCINNYDWEIIVDKIENAYEEVLST